MGGGQGVVCAGEGRMWYQDLSYGLWGGLMRLK